MADTARQLVWSGISKKLPEPKRRELFLHRFYSSIYHGEGEEETYASLCTIVRDEIEHRFNKDEKLPTPSVRATRDLDFAVA